MSNTATVFAAALLFTVFLAALMSITPGTKIYIHNKAMKACEAELPRNQSCIITAIPENKP